jgi:hypothetical protein
MKKLFYVFAIALFLLGCKKDSLQDCTGQGCMDAEVIWGGDPAVDGAGWYIRAEGKAHFVDNLPDRYKVQNLAVRVCLSETNRTHSCLCFPLPPLYHIEHISKR